MASSTGNRLRSTRSSFMRCNLELRTTDFPPRGFAPMMNRTMVRLLVLALGNFAVGTGALVLAGVLPMLARDVGVDVGTAGQLVAVYALAYALAAPIISTLASGIPRRKLLVTAMAVLALGSVVGCVATSFPVLVVARVVAA